MNTRNITNAVWGDLHGMPVACQLEVQKHLHDYAEQSGAIAYYEETGEVLPAYEEYAADYYATMNCSGQAATQRGAAMIFKNYFGGSAWFVPFRLYFMPPGWNDKVSRYHTFGIYDNFTVFEHIFFGNRLATIWDWGWHDIRFWYHLKWLDNLCRLA